MGGSWVDKVGCDARWPANLTAKFVALIRDPADSGGAFNLGTFGGRIANDGQISQLRKDDQAVQGRDSPSEFGLSLAVSSGTMVAVAAGARFWDRIFIGSLAAGGVGAWLARLAG
jgi:hypothetical protein